MRIMNSGFSTLPSSKTEIAPVYINPTFVKLEEGLDSWCGEVKGTIEYKHRLLAAQKIRQCYFSKEPVLTLGESLGESLMESLPPALKYLTHITFLSLENCNIKDLPSEIKFLTNLKMFFASSCNKLTAIPPEIGSLSNLRRFHVSSTRVEDIPHSLATLSSKCSLRIESSKISKRTWLAFQDAIDQAKKENPDLGPIFERVRETRIFLPPMANTFDEVMKQYLDFMSGIPELKEKDPSWICNKDFKNKFSETEKKWLHRFLDRVRLTDDFQDLRTHGGTLFSIYHILKALLTAPEECKTDLFKLIENSLFYNLYYPYPDPIKITMTLNQIEVKCRLLSPALGSDLGKLSHFLIAYHRLRLLHEKSLLLVKRKNIKDSVKAILFVESQLQKSLNLPIREGVLYPAAAPIETKELDEIRSEILWASNDLLRKRGILCGQSYGLSKLNPFILDINGIWERALMNQYPAKFKEIESSSNPERKKELILSLTDAVLENPTIV